MPEVKMHTHMRTTTLWICSLLVFLTAAFSTQSYAQEATEAAVLVTPLDEEQILVTDSTASVVLEWEAVPNATTHEVQLFYTDDTSLEPIPLKTKVLSDTSQSYVISDLLAFDNLPVADGDLTFHWRVRGRNALGEAEWSEVWQFTLVFPITWLQLPADGIEIDELALFADTLQAISSQDTLITYSVDSAAVALGVTLTDSVFTWTPIESLGAGTYSITFTADDGVSTVDSTITIVVAEVNLAPELDMISDTGGFPDQEITFTATATDADTLAPPPFTFNTLTYSLENAQPGMAIDPVTGVFTWTPTEADTFVVTVVVTDDGAPNLSDSQEVTIIVSEDDPQWIRLPAQGTPLDELVAFADSVVAISSLPDTIIYSINPEAEALGIAFTPDGQFSWTPTETQGPGSYDVTFTATNGTNTVDSTVTLVVNEVNLAPELALIPDQIGIQGILTSFLAEATDPDTLAPAPFTFNALTFSLENAEPGMVIDPTTGAFTWTPTAPGTFIVTVVVTDDGSPNLSDSQDVVITVPDDPFSWIRLPADGTTIDELTTYADSVEAISSLPDPIVYSINPEAEALGIVLLPDGQLSWTPTEEQGPDSYDVTFTATDGTNTSDSTITIVVNEVNLAPELEMIAEQRTRPGVEVGFMAMATDDDILAPEPFTFNTLEFSLQNEQPGMAIDAATGAFTWTPPGEGVFTVTVVVTDDGVDPLSDSQVVTITVQEISIINSCPTDEIAPVLWTNLFDDQGQAIVDSVTIQISPTENGFDAPLISQGLVVDSTFSEPLGATTVDLGMIPVGPLHYWRVIAQIDDTEIISEVAPFRRWAEQVTIQNSLQFQSANKTEDFRMISVPGASQIEISSTFSGNQAAPGPLSVAGDWDWSVWVDDKRPIAYDDYLENPTLSGQMFEPGVGYWAISKSFWNVPQTDVATVTLQNGFFFAIPLNQEPDQSKWTMIGNPFDFPVSWDEIVGANPAITGDRELWDWTGTQYEAVTILEPFKGYYFFNRDNLPELEMPCNLSPVAPKAPAKQDLLATLGLSISSDRMPDSPVLSNVEIAWHEEADEGLDSFDLHAPPPLFESYRVSLVNEALDSGYPYLGREVRTSFDDQQSFRLELKSVPGETVYLSAAGLDSLTTNEIYLFDVGLGKAYNLREQSVVAITSRQEVSDFRLVIGDAAYIQEEQSELVPDDFVLQQSYPNPFVNQTTIEYSLPDAEFVTLEVYNMIGQRVRTLVHSEQDAGHHRIAWDGRNEAGESVASGVYMYVFTSPSHRATEQLVRLR